MAKQSSAFVTNSKTLSPALAKLQKQNLLALSVGDPFPISNTLAIGPGFTATVVETLTTSEDGTAVVALVSFGSIPVMTIKAVLLYRSLIITTLKDPV